MAELAITAMVVAALCIVLTAYSLYEWGRALDRADEALSLLESEVNEGERTTDA